MSLLISWLSLELNIVTRGKVGCVTIPESASNDSCCFLRTWTSIFTHTHICTDTKLSKISESWLSNTRVRLDSARVNESSSMDLCTMTLYTRIYRLARIFPAQAGIVPSSRALFLLYEAVRLILSISSFRANTLIEYGSPAPEEGILLIPVETRWEIRLLRKIKILLAEKKNVR